MPSKKNTSKRYLYWKKAQYDKAVRESKRLLDYKAITEYENSTIARNIEDTLATINTEGIPSQELLRTLSRGASNAIRIRYKNALTKSVSELLSVGIQHTVADLLYQLPKIRKAFDKSHASFSSFNGKLSDFVIDDSEDEEIATFNSRDDLTAKELQNLQRAEEELNRIAYSLDELEQAGLLDNTQTRRERIARMSYEERYRFLYLLRSVDNFKQRAEASRYRFISDTYTNQRQQVLAEDLGGKYDEYIREKIAKFLVQENRYISSIKSKEAGIRGLASDIQKKLEQQDRRENGLSKSEIKAKQQSYVSRAQTIISTEVSTAYNFGKLIGFSGIEDLQKELEWNADWELETATNDYEVCKECAQMDGRRFTVEQLLVIGTKLDVGPSGFGRSARRTSFKNPTLPMVPFHPNCACFWTIVDSDIRMTSDMIYEDIPIAAVNQLDPERTIIPNATASTGLAMQLAGAGLLVGGAFLLSRSNLWNIFARSMATRPIILPSRPIDRVFVDTFDYVDDFFSSDVKDAFVSTAREAVPHMDDIPKPPPSYASSPRPSTGRNIPVYPPPVSSPATSDGLYPRPSILK